MIIFFHLLSRHNAVRLQGSVTHPAATAMIGKDVINCQPGDLLVHQSCGTPPVKQMVIALLNILKW